MIDNIVQETEENIVQEKDEEITQKYCNTCKTFKDISEFNKSVCKPCHRKMCRDYKARHREEISDYNKQYKAENKEMIKDYNHEYNKTHRKEIQERQTKQHAVRRKEDPNYKMACALRGRLHSALKNAKAKKKCKTMDLLGCSMKFFLKWLKFQFDEEMTLQNHGDVWHMDHLIPCARFDLTDEEEQKKCFHWTNIQPLFGLDNLVKNDKITHDEIEKQDKKIKKFVKKYEKKYGKIPTIIDYDKTIYV